jgi:flavin reductase (DIM6/NTAB) family NADH-FMN oxidoreductase RutF
MVENPPGPPRHLDGPLELDAEAWSREDAYYLLTGLTVPRPIAWVSTVSAAGLRNLAPYSFFNAVADDPPTIMFTSEGVKDTVRNIRETGDFVVNFVGLELAERMEMTAVAFPPEEDEFVWAGLEAAPSFRVAPLRVAAARGCLECRLDRVIEVGKATQLVLGRVVHFHVAAEAWRDGRVDPRLYRPLCRLGGRYAELGPIFKLNEPTWDEVREAGVEDALTLIRKETQ